MKKKIQPTYSKMAEKFEKVICGNKNDNNLKALPTEDVSNVLFTLVCSNLAYNKVLNLETLKSDLTPSMMFYRYLLKSISLAWI